MESHVREKIETAMSSTVSGACKRWNATKETDDRKKKIVNLLMEGFDPGAIASITGMNKRTLKNYFSSLARDYGIPAQHNSPYITYMRIFYLEAIRRGLYTPTVRESVSLGE